MTSLTYVDYWFHMGNKQLSPCLKSCVWSIQPHLPPLLPKQTFAPFILHHLTLTVSKHYLENPLVQLSITATHSFVLSFAWHQLSLETSQWHFRSGTHNWPFCASIRPSGNSCRFCYVVCTAAYPTRIISECSACLIWLTCLYFVDLLISACFWLSRLQI